MWGGGGDLVFLSPLRGLTGTTGPASSWTLVGRGFAAAEPQRSCSAQDRLRRCSRAGRRGTPPACVPWVLPLLVTGPRVLHLKSSRPGALPWCTSPPPGSAL